MSFTLGLWPCSIDKAVAAPTIEYSPPLTLREIVEQAVAAPTIDHSPPLTLPGLRERFLAGEFRASSSSIGLGVAGKDFRSSTINGLSIEPARGVEPARSFAFASTLHLQAGFAHRPPLNEVNEGERAAQSQPGSSESAEGAGVAPDAGVLLDNGIRSTISTAPEFK